MHCVLHMQMQVKWKLQVTLHGTCPRYYAGSILSKAFLKSPLNDLARYFYADLNLG